MRKQRKKANSAAKRSSKAQAAQAAQAPAKPDRRAALRKMANWGLGAAALGAFGIWTVNTVRARMVEADLSQIGEGVPTIVQVHDTTCSICRSLMREAKAAVSGIDEDRIHYRVATLQTSPGRTFAERYGATSSTLLLFDRQGRLRQTLVGYRPQEQLQPLFEQLSNHRL